MLILYINSSKAVINEHIELIIKEQIKFGLKHLFIELHCMFI